MQRSSRQFVALDLLRGLAALMVLLVHVRGGAFVEFGALPEEQRTPIVALFFGVTRLGQEAVMLFFVLSGFLVGGQVITRARHGEFIFSRYVIDRCSRILLPLIPACLLTAGVAIVIFGRSVSLETLIGNMIGLNGLVVQTLDFNAPLWSLAYEIWFYVAAGAIAYLFTKGPSITGLLVIAAATVVFSKLDASYLLYWCFGAMMVIFLNGRKSAFLFMVGTVLALIGTVLVELSSASQSFTNKSYVPIETARALLCIGVALMLPMLCQPTADSLLNPVRRIAQAIAAASYSIYLTHYPINAALDLILPKSDEISRQSILFFLLKIVVCLLCCTLMYLMFERRTRTLRKWLVGYHWGLLRADLSGHFEPASEHAARQRLRIRRD
jgi:peptidoglycan/LPS O-acetylase OafA/YrhL